MAYARYAWVGNRIDDEDMARLYYHKQETKKPITMQVQEAVKLYLKEIEERKGDDNNA
ncbi:MAG: hypothetical protein SCARUB_01677 [Candidatus Scalindua rubra]|uniref:Uncharacterized protein n=1 Tax=Candidatus Scalindua rubra TaxID=1872076 RepID=A0A1E3XC63_9BACT|nr:MAG: hypothetical protein SCARUB_01677 [Candidatus Scalindua rubra]